MTSHASHESSQQDSPHRRAWEWWLAIIAGVAASFGAYGLWLYEIANGEAVNWGSIGYHTLQLFALHAPHLDHEVPWQLNVGRWLSAIVVLGAVARGLATVFWSECRLFSARLWGNHVVVCGLGRTGSQLAKEFRRQGRRVVAIDNGSGAEDIAEAYRSGVAIIKGDACNPTTLGTAGVDRAERILATCDDDQKNVAIAARVGELLKDRRSLKKVIECWLFIRDARLREMLRRDSVFPYTGDLYKVNVRGLDIFELAARRVLWRVPLDYEPVRSGDATVVHLVIVGFGSMGQHLALQAARVGHFSNFRKLRLTILEPHDSQMIDGFLGRYPKIAEVCDFSRVPVDLMAGHFDPETALRAIPPDVAKDLVTVAACWESSDQGIHGQSDLFEALGHDDSANLGLALTLSRERARYPQVLVYQSRRTGFGSLFPIHGRGSAIGSRLFPFGMIEDTLTIETLLHEREDEIAKVLHQDYYDKQLARGRQPGSRASFFPWEQLPERFKESNRRAGDHIGVKLRAIGYTMRKVGGEMPPVTSFDDEAFKNQVELLAQMEHRSWCAELMLQNWSYALGESNEVAKTHPSLVEWHALPDDVKKYDVDQVKIIPEALKRVGFAIYPQSS